MEKAKSVLGTLASKVQEGNVEAGKSALAEMKVKVSTWLSRKQLSCVPNLGFDS